MKIFSRTITICLCAIFISGCSMNHDGAVETNSQISDSSPAPGTICVDLGFINKINPQKRLEEYLPMAQPGGNGFGLTVYKQDGSVPEKGVIHTGKETRLFITLYSYLPNEISYKLIQFIDFSQSSVIVDDIAYENGFDFTMPPNSYVDIPMTFNISDKGLHEVLIMFAVSVNNKEMDEKYRLKTGMEQILSQRIFLAVDDANPSIPVLSYDTPPILRKGDVLGSVLLNKRQDKLTVWLIDYAKPNEEIQCFLHIGSANNKEKKQYAVLLLNEWKQAEIFDGKKVLYLKLDPDMEAIFPVTIQMPAEAGVYDITPVIIPSPYDAMSYGGVRTLGRTGIQVGEPGEE